MKTNSKEVTQQIGKHILDCVIRDGEEFTSLKDCANYVYSEFNRVSNHPYNLKKIPNDQQRFSNYLSGIPFGFFFYNNDIKEFLNDLLKSNKEFSQKSLDLYHYLIYKTILKHKDN